MRLAAFVSRSDEKKLISKNDEDEDILKTDRDRDRRDRDRDRGEGDGLIGRAGSGYVLLDSVLRSRLPFFLLAGKLKPPRGSRQSGSRRLKLTR